MLLPDKHISLAESILGLGSFLLEELKSSQSLDRLHERVRESSNSPRLPAYHDINSLMLAVMFLYTIGVIELTDEGDLRLCGS